MAIQAAATAEQIAGAIAICPAGADHLLRGLRAGTLEMRIDPGARERARGLARRARPAPGGRADGLQAAAPDPRPRRRPDSRRTGPRSSTRGPREPRKLILLPGGHHRSAQHDAELHGVALGGWSETWAQALSRCRGGRRSTRRRRREPVGHAAHGPTDLVTQVGLAGRPADLVDGAGRGAVDGARDAAGRPGQVGARGVVDALYGVADGARRRGRGRHGRDVGDVGRSDAGAGRAE